MMGKRKVFKAAAILTIALMAVTLTTGCSALKGKKSSTSKASSVTAIPKSAPVYYDFGDVMLPRELKVDIENSFVLRHPGMTAGVLSLKGRVAANSLINFFENKMPVDGWRQISVMKAPHSMMLFRKQTRWCVVSITEGKFSTYVEIWVAPNIENSGLKK